MKKNRSESIRNHLLWPLLLLLIIQAVIMAAMVLFGGVSKKLKNNEIHILSENSENTRLYMEKETIHQWFNIVNDSGTMAAQIQEILDREGKSTADIADDYELNQAISGGIVEKSVELLRRSLGTGIFVVLDGPAALNSPSEMKAGFYIRDSNPGGYTQDYSSLLMERGLPSIANDYGIPLDSFWELGFTLGESSSSTSFFTNPYEYAKENGAAPKQQLSYAYLSRPFRLSPKDMPIITYSVPIIMQDGEIIGVFGLEMSVARLEQLLGSDRPESSFDISYVLGIRSAGECEITPVASYGYLYNQYFKDSDTLECTEKDGINHIVSPDGTKWYGSVKKLAVYSHNTPFEQEEWVLIGLARRKDLLSFYNSIRRMILSSMLVPVIFSLLGVFIIGKIVTDPIRRLVTELRAKSGVHGLSLKRVNISEIDELTETIEQLSCDVERSAAKISSILDNADVLIGEVEYQKQGGMVFLSRTVFEMMGWEAVEEPYCYIPFEEFETMFRQSIGELKQEGNNYVFCVKSAVETRYIRLILDIREEGDALGVLSDVTADVMEKEKLERERNYDLLTGLFNRRAFRERAFDFLRNNGDVTAAIAMWDLDNLKYINDTYGHDEGDRYIVLFASCLKELEKDGAVVSRYSGDEFVTLVYGSGGKDELRKRIHAFMDLIKERTLVMEAGYKIPVRVSGGLAWYPDDASDFDTLISYADFAMYMVKHSVKGIVMEFDFNDYSNNSYMLAGREELNRMLETREVKFAYQPIVRLDGSIYGYELLMRPELVNLKGINEVLNLARAQAKLKQMEALTWFAGLKSLEIQKKEGVFGPETHFFINSIASARMENSDEEELCRLYGKYLPQVVMEVTEGEPVNQEYMNHKLEFIRENGGMIAIDDYGSGYNNDTTLIDMSADIVKIDMGLVRHIEKDAKRQTIVNNLIGFAKENGILVLAEGVETAEELEYLIGCGAELFQGYYIGRPQMEIRPIDPYIVRKMQRFTEKTGLSDK